MVTTSSNSPLTMPRSEGLVPVPPAKADALVYAFGNDLRRLGASSFLITGTNRVEAQFGNPDKRVNADAVLRDTINGVRLVLTSREPDRLQPDPMRAAYAATALTGLHHIDYDGTAGSFHVVAVDAAAAKRFTAILSADFAGRPVTIGAMPPKR